VEPNLDPLKQLLDLIISGQSEQCRLQSNLFLCGVLWIENIVYSVEIQPKIWRDLSANMYMWPVGQLQHRTHEDGLQSTQREKHHITTHIILS